MPDEMRNHFEKNMIFKLSSKRSPQEVSLKSLEWAVVTQLNGEKTIGQIGEILALNQDELEQIFARLTGEGLLEYVRSASPDESPSPAFINNLERQFKYYVGPVADIILNDTLNDLKTSRQFLEKRQISLLVELLSFQISNPKKRFQFQRDMLNDMKELSNGK